MKSPKTYKEAIEQSHREALYTVGAALLLFLFFWGVLFLTQDSAYSCWGLPLWFWLSCIGGYLLSVLVVWLLVKYFLCNFNLDHKEEKEPCFHSPEGTQQNDRYWFRQEARRFHQG